MSSPVRVRPTEMIEIAARREPAFSNCVSLRSVAKTGRPSKGERVLVTGRIPSRHDELLRELAAERGLYRSDLVAAMIAVALTRLDELPSPVNAPSELPLTS